MNQVEAMVLAYLLFLLVASDYLGVGAVLGAVKLKGEHGILASTEAFFVNYKVKAAPKEKIAVSRILAEKVRELDFAPHKIIRFRI